MAENETKTDNVHTSMTTTKSRSRDKRSKCSTSRDRREKKNNFMSDGEPQQEDKKDEEAVGSETQAAKDHRTVWCNMVMAKTARVLQKEFVDNKKIKPSEYTSEAYENNEPKNRYNDIICIDATRVVLKDRAHDDDYIHANWMVMPDGQKYISTQAPITTTIEDFWHMIFTEKCTVIVMLCDLTEGKSEKCARYYPKSKEKSESFGSFKVHLIEVKSPSPFENIKHQILKVEKDGSSLVVNHILNHSWLDHTAPLDPAPTVGTLRLVKKLAAGNPIVVHCSAGIGRTGTFVGLDYAAQKIEKNGNTNMIELLKELRGMRFHSIQSVLQYKFLHICLLELFVQDGAIPRSGKYTKYLELYQNGARRVNEKAKAQFNL